LLTFVLGNSCFSGFVEDFKSNVLILKDCQKPGGTLGFVQTKLGVQPEFEGFEVARMLETIVLGNQHGIRLA